MTKKLIILRGNSGSGKSTVAKKLRLKMGHGTMLIPQDTVRREIIRTPDVVNNPSIELISMLGLYGKKIGYDVIIEGIFNKAQYGDMLSQLIEKFDGETHVYYFDISFEETLERHQLKANSMEFGEKEMRGWWVEKDYLGTKGEKHITEAMTEDETIDFIYRDIS
ncbi:kinase [Candidatus Saccharibacteria bacterium]|nr:kinase [Candidatus Saccharibacteria bacterium]